MNAPACRDVRPGVAAFVFSFSAFALINSNSLAQPYPQRAIRLIVPFAPGAGTDLAARIVGQKMSETLNQPVVVDNRSGAGGVVGTDLAAKAPPDGYTLIMSNIALAFSAALYPQLPYDTVRDFAPITLVVTQPYILVVHPSLPAKSLKELLAIARARPRQIAYASGGVGSGIHLATELLKLQADIDLLHVPYKGGGPALSDLIGGQVQMMLATLASALPHIQSGKLRALAVSSPKRSPAAPNVPTAGEAGVHGYETSTWYGLQAPSGVPTNILGKLNSDVVRIVNTPDVKAKFELQGMYTVGNSQIEFAEYIRTEIDKWSRVVKASGAKGELPN